MECPRLLRSREGRPRLRQLLGSLITRRVLGFTCCALQAAILNQEASVDKVGCPLAWRVLCAMAVESVGRLSRLHRSIPLCDDECADCAPLLCAPITHHHVCTVQGEDARTSSFMGAIAIADLVKTTLGPKGMDKILQSVRITRHWHRALGALPVRPCDARVWWCRCPLPMVTLW